MKKIAIIPARIGSTRLPNKPLYKLNGKAMIRLTVERVLEGGFDPVIVATDSDLIFKECEGIDGVIPVMTREDHVCGTDRVLEAYEKVKGELGEFDLIVNVQGDEPFIDPQLLKDLLTELEKRKDLAEYWTTVADINKEEQADPNVVKAVLDQQGNALIFCRSAIDEAYKHTGIYVYTPKFLKKFCAMPASPLEKAYKLEQMRALDAGYKLNCIYLPCDAISINTIEDIEKAGITDFEPA